MFGVETFLLCDVLVDSFDAGGQVGLLGGEGVQVDFVEDLDGLQPQHDFLARGLLQLFELALELHGLGLVDLVGRHLVLLALLLALLLILLGLLLTLECSLDALDLLDVALDVQLGLHDHRLGLELAQDVALLGLEFVDLLVDALHRLLDLVLLGAFAFGFGVVLLLVVVDDFGFLGDLGAETVHVRLLLGDFGFDGLELLLEGGGLLGDVGLVADAFAHELELVELFEDAFLLSTLETLGLEHVLPVLEHLVELLLVLGQVATLLRSLFEFVGLLVVEAGDFVLDLGLLEVEFLEHLQVPVLLLNELLAAALGFKHVGGLLLLEFGVDFSDFVGEVEFLVLQLEDLGGQFFDQQLLLLLGHEVGALRQVGDHGVRVDVFAFDFREVLEGILDFELRQLAAGLAVLILGLLASVVVASVFSVFSADRKSVV